MKDQKEIQETNEIDPQKLWEEVKRAASRAPEWASLEAPYPVKPNYIQQPKDSKSEVTKDSGQKQ